ncbi:hypothetical protein AAU18_12775 [Listeria monocytogenes]|uniref:DUF7916 family protein n=1 Tax=Listeria monocytogenes TaxID=1639 RepID=UPI00083CC1B1|nr:hypothetical protein [Listeria monocytogenes]EHC5246001.1 hypothetical protein [Listeria monocytogenes serotype 1/2a]EAA0025124.1 hypothetical protein [Listeria monocytogenes]EAC3131669.1 hypothetical protein [Listeria monocytogenes]EAC4523577.1 hypothetical protein [Listeria monocytogenes]EAC4953851.1 hypothetical protein [Listeria monocytogenes]
MEQEVTRLISASKQDFEKMNGRDLKRSIFQSEGRVIMAQHLLFASQGLVRGVTNTELLAAFGSDMIMLNTFNLEDEKSNLGLQGLTLEDLKKRVNIPLGIYLGCPGENKTSENIIYDAAGMLATDEHLLRAKEIGADFIVLGGNPGSGTSIQDIIETTKRARKLLGNDVLIFAGKWEDGIDEKVLGDPLAKQDAKEVIKQLIDAGADVIDLPTPGSRHGISVRMIQELVQFIHLYKPGTLAMTFLNSSVEGADQDTIRLIALMMKETGADIHAIGDGGFSGCTTPENVMQLSISLKGKPYTYFRMASRNR